MKSLRTSLLLAYAGLILAGFSVLALLAGRQILSGTVQDFSGGIVEQAQLVARVLKEPVEEGTEHGVNQTTLRPILQRYAEQEGADLIVFDDRGQILASSNNNSDTNMSVVRTALSGNAGSDAQGNMVYAAAPILEDGQVIGVVQVSAPLSAAQDLVWERWLTLGGAVAVTVLGLSALGGWAALEETVAPAFLDLWQPVTDPNFPWTGILFGAPILGVWYSLLP